MAVDNGTPADGATITSALLDGANVKETYEELNPSASNPTGAGVGKDAEYDWVIQNNGVPSSKTYCFRTVKNDSSTLSYSAYPEISTPSPTFNQTNFRWYENGDVITPTSSLAALNATATNVVAGQVARLRLDVAVATENLATSSQAFKLQFATSTAGSWTDVGATSSAVIWRGFDNGSVADGATITSALLVSTNTLQSYEESNNSVSNPTQINTGERGEWDWVLENNNASSSQTYYFRELKSSGVAFSTYTRYPALTTAAGPDATSFVNNTEGGLTAGGRPNQNITITGSNFGTACTASSTEVKIGTYEVACSYVSSWASSSITFTVPTSTAAYGGTGTNGLIVRASNQDDATPLDFLVYPDVTSIMTPSIADAARETENITLNGLRFGTSGSVTVLGIEAATSSWGDTSVTATVPPAIDDNTYTGAVIFTRTLPSGNASDTATSSFRILPRIASLTPTSGEIGDGVTIAGNHFCQTGICPASGERKTTTSTVTFGGVAAEDADITTWTATSVVAKVPQSAVTGVVIVKSNNFESNNLTFTVGAGVAPVGVGPGGVESTPMSPPAAPGELTVEEIRNVQEKLNAIEKEVERIEDAVQALVGGRVPEIAEGAPLPPEEVAAPEPKGPSLVERAVERAGEFAERIALGFGRIAERAQGFLESVRLALRDATSTVRRIVVGVPDLVKGIFARRAVPPAEEPKVLLPPPPVFTLHTGELKLVAQKDKPIQTIVGYRFRAEIKPEKPARAVTDTFAFGDPDGDGIWAAEIEMPPFSGAFTLAARVDYEDGEKREISNPVLIDPEGYIYEGTPRGELRIREARITLFVRGGDVWVPWPAERYGQVNPQVTGRTGAYSFLAPAGTYYLGVVREGYAPYRSEVFSLGVPTPITRVIELEYLGP